MHECELRALLHEVKVGRLGRRAFVGAMLGLGLTTPLAQRMLTEAGLAHAQTTAPAGPGARQARGRRPPAPPVVAGAHAAEQPLRHRHQGRGRLPAGLRATRLLRSRRQFRARPGRRDSHSPERRPRQGRQDRHLAAEEGRRLARRQALHRRRRGLHLGIRRRSGHGRGEPEDLRGRPARRAPRRPHGEGRVQGAACLLV